MSEKTCTELIVREVSKLQHSPKGNPYVECRVDGGVVAVWGSPGNMNHIEDVTGAISPFRMVVDCIPSNWRQHDLWVYEQHEIYVIEPMGRGSAARPEPIDQGALVSLGELSAWRRQIATWVSALEGARPVGSDGLAGRIGALSFGGSIPREVASLMRAVTEMRNAAEYDSKVLSKTESLAVRNAWLAVCEWAQSKGLQT